LITFEEYFCFGTTGPLVNASGVIGHGAWLAGAVTFI